MICEYGLEADCLYILKQGCIIVTNIGDTTNNRQKIIETKYAIFGELSLIFDEKRSAKIIAWEDNTIVLKMPKTVFLELSLDFQIAKYINSLPLFKEVDKLQKLKMAEKIEIVTFKSREYIFKSGQEFKDFWVIFKGKVDYLKDTEDGDGSFIHLKTLSSDDHIGEQALLGGIYEKKCKILNARAKGEATLYRFPYETLKKLFPQIKPYLNIEYLKSEKVTPQKKVEMNETAPAPKVSDEPENFT